MGFISTIFDLIFPSFCLSCGKRGEELCINCLKGLPEAERETEKWIFPIFDYRHPVVKKAVWLLKYKGHRSLAKIFAESIWSRMQEEIYELEAFENFKNPILVPIPLSRKRFRERGFNQAEKICEELVKLARSNLRHGVDAKLEMEKNVLAKPKNTEHQARIENRKERMQNVVDSFAIGNEERVSGQNIILIDDVTTTGATLKEAKKVLREAGAKKIIAFTFAH